MEEGYLTFSVISIADFRANKDICVVLIVFGFLSCSFFLNFFTPFLLLK